MLAGRCYQRHQAVDITPALACLSELEYIYSQQNHNLTTVPNVNVPKPIQELVDGLGLGGETVRLFVRKLRARESIHKHVDEHDWMKGFNIRRFHIPLISHPDIKMYWTDIDELYLEPGYLWEVKYDIEHYVVNYTPQQRIHIQIDQSNATIN